MLTPTITQPNKLLPTNQTPYQATMLSTSQSSSGALSINQTSTYPSNTSFAKSTTASIKLSGILVSLILACPLFADVPTVGNTMQGVAPAPKPKAEPVINIEPNKSTPQLPTLDSNQTALIKDVVVKTMTGGANTKQESTNLKVSSTELADIIAPYKNKELTLNEINNMVTSITKLYRQSGYFVARAFVPRAALDTNNVLTIKVIEGVYGVFKIDNSSLVSNNTLDGIFNKALQGEVISSDSLERAVLLADDLSGADIASADIGPGGEVGTSDFLVKAVPTPRFDGYLTGDNYGSKYTGLYRFTVGANANSPLGIGDKLSVVGMITDGNGLKNGSINYGAPIMSNGLNLSGGYYNTQYSLGEDYANLDAIGNTSAIQATLSYPFISSKLENLNFSVNPQMQLLSDKQLGENTQKRAGLGVFSMDYSKISLIVNKNTSLRANLGYTLGNLTFKDSADAGYNEATINTQGTFSKLSASLNANVDLIEALTFKNTLNAQFAMAKKNLDGSQDITIGGAYAVRAYPSTQESGDSGYVYTAELSYALPSLGSSYHHSISTFYDVGRSFMANTNSSLGTIPFNAQILQDAGIGYQASYKDFFGKVQIAQVVGGVQVAGVPFYTTKGLFQVGWMW